MQSTAEQDGNRRCEMTIGFNKSPQDHVGENCRIYQNNLLKMPNKNSVQEKKLSTFELTMAIDALR